jgi:hypothetical protein
MSEGLTVLSTLFLLGAYHGINPGMGWLFAVARGMQEHRARAVAWSLAPIALGHALSIGVVVLIFQLAKVALPMLHIRVGVAVTLVALGVYKLIRSRHFRWGGMQAGFCDLTIWSFLMASAHGAGLMVLPVVLAGPHAHHMAAAPRGNQRRAGNADPYPGVLYRHRGGGVARLREVRPGNASPVLVQSGPDLGDGAGGNRARSVTDLTNKATSTIIPGGSAKW